METKVCSKCGKELPLTEYTREMQRGKPKYKAQCRNCCNAYSRARRAELRKNAPPRPRVRNTTLNVLGKTDSLCWHCQHAHDIECDWIAYNKPVEGFKTDTVTNTNYACYKVLDCPKYVEAKHMYPEILGEYELNGDYYIRRYLAKDGKRYSVIMRDEVECYRFSTRDTATVMARWHTIMQA